MIGRAASLALAGLVTAACLWWLITPATLTALKTALAKADWLLLGAALAISGGVQWWRAWRFSTMTTGGLAFPEAKLVRIAFQLNFYNFILPFRLGELSYPVLMRRAYGQSLLHATGVLVLTRIFDLCTVAAVLLGLASWLGLAGGWGDGLLMGAALLLAAAPLALVAAGQALKPLVLSLSGLRRIAEPLGAGFDALGSPSVRIAALAMSFAVWLTFGGVAILCAAAVSDSMEPPVAMLGAAAGNLAFALPINGVAGLGPAQAAWVAAVTQAGTPFADAVTTALTLHAVALAAAFIFGGVAMLGGVADVVAPLAPRAAPAPQNGCDR